MRTFRVNVTFFDTILRGIILHKLHSCLYFYHMYSYENTSEGQPSLQPSHECIDDPTPAPHRAAEDLYLCAVRGPLESNVCSAWKEPEYSNRWACMMAAAPPLHSRWSQSMSTTRRQMSAVNSEHFEFPPRSLVST